MAKFTPEEDAYIAANYLQVASCRMSKVLGRSKSSVPQRMKVLGLFVPAEIKQKFKTDSQIKKGNTPQNKGKKWSEFMSKEGEIRSLTTTFKKGSTPHNTKYDLAISKRIDKRGFPYLFIRVSLCKWMPLQRYIWEQINGRIPTKHKIVFKNGNTLDCNIENLEMLTYKEAMLRNSSQRFGAEVFKLIQLRGALNRKINNKIKLLENEK